MQNSAKWTLLFVVVGAFTLSSPASAERKGPGSTGGGNAVMIGKQIRLIDSLTFDELQSIEKNSAWEGALELTHHFADRADARLVREKDFFSCAKDKILSSSVFNDEQKHRWLGILKGIQVTLVSLPNIEFHREEGVEIARAAYLATHGGVAFYHFAFSGKTDRMNQIPLATYDWPKINVYDEFYSSLPENDQCGTQVHEAIRVYGDMIGTAFTTDEVEALTQSIMGYPILTQADYNSALVKVATVQ